jgi:acyl transferase domain-containing protein
LGFNLPLAASAKMVSSVTNSVLPENTLLDADYWSANLLSPVLFNQAIHTIATDAELADVDLLIEIGPHSTLAGPIRQIKSKFGFSKLQYLPTLLRGEDSAVSLLKTAGELFLRDYPLDMKRITAIEETTTSGKILSKTGNFIVDLPTYQWDMNKKYWAEARASKEHRQPKFPRHDILGSMILGGSFSEPTWRNVLRIRDLPWLKDHSLGGEAVFPAAAYFSMAMEAVTQLNEISTNPAIIQGYTLRDISIKNALVTPDNDTGIEVMFGLRPSMHAEKDNKLPWWDFNVSSVSEEGHRNDHMAGSISISTDTARPSARKLPDFPQRASGKAWNQALRDVGFDYGPTFQDMHAIGFDGKTYAARSKTTVKQAVEHDESRHVVHPATVDSCLQLLIVAIYAGRTNAMPCGAVPIQVDQVSIWKPTDAQIADSTAEAYSWIDQRGVRSFVGSNQLIASDGQVLMEITDMRCSLYEAAVPQRAKEPSKPQPFGEMLWKLDVDSLASFEELDVPSFIDLVNFKEPGIQLLDIGSQYSQEILRKVPDLKIVATESLSELIEPRELSLQGYKNAQVKELDMAVDLGSQGFKAATFDLVITRRGTSNDLASVKKLLKAGGRVVLDSSSTAQTESLEGLGFFDNAVFGKAKFVVATAVAAQTNGVADHSSTKVQLIYRSRAPELSSKLKSLLGLLQYVVVTSDLATIEEVQENVIFLADFESPLLPSISEAEFQLLGTHGLSGICLSEQRSGSVEFCAAVVDRGILRP